MSNAKFVLLPISQSNVFQTRIKCHFCYTISRVLPKGLYRLRNKDGNLATGSTLPVELPPAQVQQGGVDCGLCSRPECWDDMIQCELCDEWFHLTCEGLETAPEGEWLCRVCRPPDNINALSCKIEIEWRAVERSFIPSAASKNYFFGLQKGMEIHNWIFKWPQNG